MRGREIAQARGRPLHERMARQLAGVCSQRQQSESASVGVSEGMSGLSGQLCLFGEVSPHSRLRSNPLATESASCGRLFLGWGTQALRSPMPDPTR